MLNFRVITVLLFSTLTVYGQRYTSIINADEDGLLTILKSNQQSKSESKEIYTRCFLAEKAIDKSSFREAEAHLLQAVSIIRNSDLKRLKKKIKNRYTVLDSYEELARYYTLINDNNKVLQIL